jgi:hypothetical protein
MHLTKLLSLSALAAVLASCASAAVTQQPDITRVVSTTSFGMCVGYCTTELEITEGQAVLTRLARGGRGAPGSLPPQRYSMPLTASEWREIQSLAAAADFDALPDVVGCPDCADGGAEGLTVEDADGAESVSLEFRANVREVQPLLTRVRAIRDRLMPAS